LFATLMSSSCIIARSVRWQTPSGVAILKNASFSLGLERSGLVGPNGAGKTTLLRILFGELAVSGGDVSKECQIGYLRQNCELQGNVTVAEALGVARKLEAIEAIERGSIDEGLFDLVGGDWEIASRAEAQLARVGLGHLDLARRIESLSAGEVTQIALAGILIEEPDFLMLDEPTNNLDSYAREALYDLVDNWDKGALIVSHDRELLNLVDQVFELSGGELKVYGGSYDFYRAEKEMHEHAAVRRIEAAKQGLRRERRAAQRSSERQQRRSRTAEQRRGASGQARIILGVWKESSQKTAARLHRVHERRIEQARHDLEEAKARLCQENVLKLDLAGTTLPAGKAVVDLRNVSFSYAPSVDPLIRDLTLRVVGPGRLAIRGRNGAGKTTLLRIIAGELFPTSGHLNVGVNELAYLPQATLLLNSESTVLETFLSLSTLPNESIARQHLSKYLFSGDDAFKKTGSLSGGERIRLALGGVLSRPSGVRLLILDEPTNNLDLNGVQQLESALQQYAGALIVASHDNTFLRAIGIERELCLD